MDDMNIIDAYKKALFDANLECAGLLSSREFRIGKEILEMFNAIKKHDLYKLKKILAGHLVARKLKKMSFSKMKSAVVENEPCDHNPKVAVYTCIVGDYDEVVEPIFLSDDIDFFIFCDKPISNLKRWVYRPVPPHLLKLGNTLANRYIKLHPHEFFPNYDYSVYVDGNVKVANDVTSLLSRTHCKSGIAMFNHASRDCVYDESKICMLFGKGCEKKIKTQIASYRKEGFPSHWGLKEAPVIFTDLKNENSKITLENWWEELIASKSLRDQLAFPYSLWKNGCCMSDVGTLGVDVHNNGIFRMYAH